MPQTVDKVAKARRIIIALELYRTAKVTLAKTKSKNTVNRKEKKKTQKQKTGFNNYTSGRDYEMNNLERSLLGISEGGEHGGNS